MHNPFVIPACEEFSGVLNPCAGYPDKNPTPDLHVVPGVKIERLTNKEQWYWCYINGNGTVVYSVVV